VDVAGSRNNSATRGVQIGGMFKRWSAVLLCLTVATVAHAQPGGGGHGGGGGGGRGGHGGGSSGGSSSAPAPDSAPKHAPTPVNQLEIVGVIKAIDPSTDRVTIAYEAVEALNWPPGTQPFPVAKTALLEGATVGEKVRFTVDSGQIATLKPF
jgi:Cu/Ag efflux protein CusF